MIFTKERKDLLISFLDQHKSHRAAGTLETFWHIVISAYVAKFPDDDVTTPSRTLVPPKTKCGRPSKKRAADQPKPLHEVRFLVNIVQVTI